MSGLSGHPPSTCDEPSGSRFDEMYEEDPIDAHRASPLGNVEYDWNCRCGPQHMVLLM